MKFLSRFKQNSVGDEFLRYAIVGGVAFLVDFALLALLTSNLGLHYLPSVMMAFLMGTWVNYQLSVHWVFAYRAVDARGAEFGMFLLVGVVTLGLSLALMALFVEALDIHVLTAKCMVAAFTLVSNFAGRRLLLFTRWSAGQKGKNYA